MRTIAGRIITLLLDQKYLALRRQFGDQVRCQLLPFVGLQKQLAARTTLAMQRGALANRATASMAVDKSYTKSLKDASKRLSTMNFGGDVFANQAAHPQGIDRLPDFGKKHAQYEQMMDIMQVALVGDEVGVVVPQAGGQPAGRRSSLTTRRSLSSRHSLGGADITANSASENLLDFDFDYEQQPVCVTEPAPPSNASALLPQQQQRQQIEVQGQLQSQVQGKGQQNCTTAFESSNPFSNFESTTLPPSGSSAAPSHGSFDGGFGR